MSKKFVRLIFSLGVFLFLFISIGKAQNNLVLYHGELFNSSEFNPAFLHSNERFTFSIFPLAGMSADFNDKEAISHLSELLFYDEVNDAMRDIFRSMVNKKLFYQHGEVALLNIGYHNDFGSFNFTVKDNVLLFVNFYGEMSKFLMNTVDSITPLGDTQRFPAEAVHFREYGLGFSKEVIPDKLRVGVKAKLLFGKAFLSSHVEAAPVENNNDYYISTRGRMDISLPAERVTDGNGNFIRLEPFSTQSIADYFVNSKNTGVGFDVGLSYQINPFWKVSASAINIGSIHWKSNLHSLEFNGNHLLDKDDIDLVTSPDGTIYLHKVKDDVSLDDDLSELFKINKVGDTDFSEAIPASYYVGASYELSPDLQLGFVDRFIKYKDFSFNSVSLTADYKLSKRLNLVTGYSVFGNSYFNIPVGFYYRWNGGQAYLSSDNFLAAVMPSEAGFFGLSFGACFYILRPKMKYDRVDYLPFFKKKRKRVRNQKGLIFKNE